MSKEQFSLLLDIVVTTGLEARHKKAISKFSALGPLNWVRRGS